MSTEISTQRAGGLALQRFDDALKFANMVAKSDFAPKDFRAKPESCLLAIQHGAEIGLSPMQSLQSVAVINGRPSIWGDAAMAVVMASPVCEYVTERIEGDGDAMVAICEAKRKGYPKATVVRFSVADAKKAGLWGKSGPWTQYARRMLQLRARGFALRDGFPDVLKGLVTAEEAQDYQNTESQAVVVTAPSPAKVTPVVAQPPALSAFEIGKQKVEVCVSLDALDVLRSRVDAKVSDGTLTEAERDELVRLIHAKAEELINDDGGLGSPTAEEATA